MYICYVCMLQTYIHDVWLGLECGTFTCVHCTLVMISSEDNYLQEPEVYEIRTPKPCTSLSIFHESFSHPPVPVALVLRHLISGTENIAVFVRLPKDPCFSNLTSQLRCKPCCEIWDYISNTESRDKIFTIQSVQQKMSSSPRDTNNSHSSVSYEILNVYGKVYENVYDTLLSMPQPCRAGKDLQAHVYVVEVGIHTSIRNALGGKRCSSHRWPCITCDMRPTDLQP
ncbi:hypothetical protein F5Y09DRAFT_107065 [Xylaria sp. FL1042]|nr:hypothetical protein F5Y09DRAFT_107065 [Xylaria sp. FL1042]